MVIRIIQSSCRLFLLLILVTAEISISQAAQTQNTVREITILNWSEYMDPALIKKFEKLHNIKFKEIYFESDDYRDNYILETQAKGVDIIVLNGPRIRT